MTGNPVRPADDLCTLIYTSGTTGMPKGVMHSFGTFAWSITSGMKRVPLDQNARVLSFLPLAHVAERMVVEHGLLATGMHVFFAESLETFVADIQRARPTVFFAVPRLWVKFQQGVQAKMPPEKLAKLLKIPFLRGIVKKKVLAGLGLDQAFWAAGGAAPMPPSLLNWYRSLGLDIVEVYGMTENCGLSHSTVLGKPRPGTVGTTYDGVLCRIDPVSGEIQVKGECVMLGYYKKPEVTAATFTDDGWLKTGDKGAVDAGRQSDHHRPRQGLVQDRQGQVCGAGADREQAGHPSRDRGLLRDRRQPRPTARAADAQCRGGGQGTRRRRPRCTGGFARRAPEGGERAAGSARAAGMPGDYRRPVVGRE
jgi:long-chain acyl-CoA synthetase